MSESNESQQQAGQPRGRSGLSWRVFLLLTLGIIAGLVGMQTYRMVTDWVHPRPAPEDKDQHETATAKPEVDTEAVRKEAWRRIQPRLEAADAKTRELTNQLVHRIEAFFDERKAGAQPFGEAMVSFRSKIEFVVSRKETLNAAADTIERNEWWLKWAADSHVKPHVNRLIWGAKDGLREVARHMRSEEEFRDYIRQEFQKYIFSQDELAALLKEASDEYAQGLRAVENELLVQVRADLEDLPASALPAFANDNVLASHFDNIVATVAANVARDLQVDVGREITSFAVEKIVEAVVTRTLTAVATRLGISGAILGTGAASSWATVGAGIVIAIAVDFLLDWIIGWFHDPAGDIADKVIASLDDVKTLIMNGDPDAWKVHDRIEQMATEHPDSAIRAKAAKVLANIERGGALGLKYALGQVAEVQNRSRELALKRLVFEEGQQR